jgi:glycosyltransferase involved in cell wall biosynthesis
VRVLIVTHRFPPFGVSGVERVAEQTARELMAAGDEVIVLTRRQSIAPALPRLERSSHRGTEVLMIAGGGPLHGRFPKHATVLERLFERTLLETQPDVVLATHLMDHSPGYVAIARRWRIPVVLELHDYYTICEQARLQRVSGELCDGPNAGSACAAHCFAGQDHGLERWALRTHMFRRALEQADALVTPSQFVADQFTGTFGASIPVPRVIGNGVEFKGRPPRPPGEDGPLSVGYVGSIVAHKGVHVIVEALRSARLPAAKLTLLGVAVEPYFRELRESAAEVEGLELHALGSFAPEQLPPLLDGIDVVVVPSLWWETYSIVIREALACGIPVIASRLGALPEGIREGENGLLFTAGSSFDLAHILHALDEDRSILSRLAEGIRTSDWSSVPERAGRMREILSEVVAERRAPTPDGDFAELTILRDGLSPFAPVG